MTSKRVISSYEFKFIQVLLFSDIFFIAIRTFRSLKLALKSFRLLINHSKILTGQNKMNKAYYINGYYYWTIFNPKWPSKAFRKFIATQLESLLESKNTNSITTLFLAFTKKCPLECEHCSEWPQLDNSEVLSLKNWINIIDSWVDKGVGQVIYAGGEPLSRFNDLIEMISRYQGDIDQWIYSSGYGLTLNKALALKKAGVDGIAVSIDNHNSSQHNSFRGNEKSFQMAIDAIANCQQVGITTAINVCPTCKYVNSGHLIDFMSFAKELNVPFVHVIEPRAIGHYQAMDVEYTLKEKAIVEDIFFQYNFTPEYKEFPTILYPPVVRKQTTCRGGKSYLLIDYDGSIKNCPFCKKSWDSTKTISECTADSTLEKVDETYYKS